MSKHLRRSLFARFLQAIRRDFWRKAIAVFFAFLIYFYVYNEISSEPRKITDVPVEILLPRELIDVDPKPCYVTLSLKTARDVELTANMLRGTVQVEYGKFVPGKPYTLRLSPENFASPLGVRVMRAEPEELQLNLQQLMTRDIPVRITFANRLSNDYKSSLADCLPSRIRVTGPEQLVKELKSVSTSPIPLSETVTEPFEYVADLEPPPGCTVSPARVTCRIDVMKNFEQRTFQSLPVLLLNRPGGSPLKTEILSSARIEVTVRGLAGAVLALTPNEVRPYLDISHIDKPGVYEISAACFIKGDNLDVKELRPALLKVKITE